LVRIGVTGHRFLAELDKITLALDVVMLQIEHSYAGQSLAIISPLAEGGDRIVVHRVLKEPGANLVVALPLPLNDYLTDFETQESHKEFQDLLSRASEVIQLPPAATRNEAYDAVGKYVLDHCDVLIAIWDGQGAQGQGGTGGIVVEARLRRLPVAWIHAGNRQPGNNIPTSLGDEQGNVSFERFPYHSSRESSAQ
jgi:hypothetical protein